VRREVYSVGAKTNPETMALELDEMGTLYNELIGVAERPWQHLYKAVHVMLFGEDHPLSKTAAGTPHTLRRMQPADLRRFHETHYQPDNMGMIAAVHGETNANGFVKRLGTILGSLKPRSNQGSTSSSASGIPRPGPAHAGGEVRVITCPGSDRHAAGSAIFAWPITWDYDPMEFLMLRLFLNCLAGGLKARLRSEITHNGSGMTDIGRGDVWTSTDGYIGRAIYVGLSGLGSGLISEEQLAALAGTIRNEIAAVTSLSRSDQTLQEFNDRATNHLLWMQRQSQHFLSVPPDFGRRGGSAEQWYSAVKMLENAEGFRRSLLHHQEAEHVRRELARAGNIWSPLIAKWKLTGTGPYVAGCRIDPGAQAQHIDEKKQRLADFVKDLREAYGIVDDTEALAKYKKEYDRRTAAIERKAATLPCPRFLDSPPLSYDTNLDFQVRTLDNAVPLVASRFDSMIAVTVGIALDMRIIPKERLIYIPVLPALVSEIGVVKGNRVIDSVSMNDHLKKDVLRLAAKIVCNATTGRVELAVEGTGGDLDESQRMLEWLEAAISQPYLGAGNLPRVRQVVDRQIAKFRGLMRSGEHKWAHRLANSYNHQTNSLVLAGQCFLTQAHFMQRLRWRLIDVGSSGLADEVSEFLDTISELAGTISNERLIELADMLSESTGVPPEAAGRIRALHRSLSAENRSVIAGAFSGLAGVLVGIPKENMEVDWAYLIHQMKEDLSFAPELVLDELASTLSNLRHRRNARMYIVSSGPDGRRLEPSMEKLTHSLNDGEMAARQDHHGMPVILNRMRSRYQEPDRPTYIGLASHGRTGTLVFTAGCANLEEAGEERLLDFLAAASRAGRGSESIFMKVWKAGLAYSNGLRVDESRGEMTYFVEGSADLSDTMRFVVDKLRRATDRRGLAEYAIANAFAASRGSTSYDNRGIAMASDLADGITPELVERFRRRILGLRVKRDLRELLIERMDRTCGRLLIGFCGERATARDGTFFIVAPEIQIKRMEDYISSVEGARQVYRAFPRDFWITD
jgi:Zn-dependent M16 (insulinase) family peptidase